MIYHGHVTRTTVLMEWVFYFLMIYGHGSRGFRPQWVEGDTDTLFSDRVTILVSCLHICPSQTHPIFKKACNFNLLDLALDLPLKGHENPG